MWATADWAISQNLLLSGRSVGGEDLTNATTYAVMDAFYNGRYPQPILSVRLHRNSPEDLYRSMGRFFFTPGQLTPSLFNDDSMIPLLVNNGVCPEDAQNYAVGGCQEPIIAGKDNANTTNSWLNLAKVLEVTLNEGCSTITGRMIGRPPADLTGEVLSAKDLLLGIRDVYYKQLDHTLNMMSETANSCSRALSNLRVPFLSCFMGGMESGIDMRNDGKQGTRYNGSGCLIHGLSILADSFQALTEFAEEADEEDCRRLLDSLRSDYRESEHIRQNLNSRAKFGNNLSSVDNEAADIVNARIGQGQKAEELSGKSLSPRLVIPLYPSAVRILDGSHTGTGAGPSPCWDTEWIPCTENLLPA